MQLPTKLEMRVGGEATVSGSGFIRERIRELLRVGDEQMESSGERRDGITQNEGGEKKAF